MIQVQIASELTFDGVRGVRWVLLEATEPPPAEAEVAAAAAAASVGGPQATPDSASDAALGPAVAEPVIDSLRLRALKALVVALGLAAALWTAKVQIGPPARGAPAATGAGSVARPPAPSPTPTPTPLPTPVRPAMPQSAVDAPASAPGTPPVLPATPASASLPRLTASL